VAIDVTLPPGAPAALVDVVTGQRVEVSQGVLSIPADPLAVHVYVAADGPCAN
jgi:hypothetical protein